MIYSKVCPGCGAKFETKNKQKIYCGKICYAKAYQAIKNQRQKEEYEEVKAVEIKRHTAPPGELSQIKEKAKKARMSYGQYVGMTEYPVKIERKW